MKFVDWLAQNWGLLLTIATTIASLVLYVLEAIKKKNAKAIQNVLSDVPELVTKAESLFGAGHGADKLQWVLTQLRLIAIEHHATVSQEELTAEIEKVVSATKNVNTDKPCQSSTVVASDSTSVEIDNQNTVA